MKSPAPLQILSWNVNGIRAAERKGFLDWLDRSAPDILCVQETKASPDQLSPAMLRPKGYQVWWASAVRKGYSGVAIFSRREPIRVTEGFALPRFDAEGRVLIAEYKEFVLLNIYFPNGGRSEDRLQFKLDFYDTTLEFCGKLRKTGKRLIVSGDYNTAHQPIDLARPVENEDVSGFLPVERQWLDAFIGAGFVDTFRLFHQEGGQYTWWDMKSRARERNIGWRIDYHFVSEDLRGHVTDAFIRPEVHGSDHCPVGVVLAGAVS